MHVSRKVILVLLVAHKAWADSLVCFKKLDLANYILSWQVLILEWSNTVVLLLFRECFIDRSS